MTRHDSPPAETAAELDAMAAAPAAPPPQRPPTKGTSMRLAMIVPGLGAFILMLFIGIEFATTPKAQVVTTSTASSAVSGSNLAAIAGAPSLKPIISAGEPPDNVINAVSLPKGSTELSHQVNTAAAGQYDAQIELRSDASQNALNTFYKSVMKRQGWALFDEGPAAHNPGAIEILGKQAGADGFYWEMGAVISATTFGPGAPATGWTDFTVRLFQVPDPE